MRRAIASLLLRWARRLDNEPVERREEEANPPQPSIGAGGAQQSVPVDTADESWILTARMRARALGVVGNHAPQMKVFASQVDTGPMSDEDIQQLALDRARMFRDEAPTTAAQAAKIILDGVKAGR